MNRRLIGWIALATAFVPVLSVVASSAQLSLASPALQLLVVFASWRLAVREQRSGAGVLAASLALTVVAVATRYGLYLLTTTHATRIALGLSALWGLGAAMFGVGLLRSRLTRPWIAGMCIAWAALATLWQGLLVVIVRYVGVTTLVGYGQLVLFGLLTLLQLLFWVFLGLNLLGRLGGPRAATESVPV